MSKIVAYAIFAGGNEVKRYPVELDKPFEITGVQAIAAAAHLACDRESNDVYIHIVTRKDA
jgi:hypothetical protein